MKQMEASHSNLCPTSSQNLEHLSPYTSYTWRRVKRAEIRSMALAETAGLIKLRPSELVGLGPVLHAIPRNSRERPRLAELARPAWQLRACQDVLTRAFLKQRPSCHHCFGIYLLSAYGPHRAPCSPDPDAKSKIHLREPLSVQKAMCLTRPSGYESLRTSRLSPSRRTNHDSVSR